MKSLLLATLALALAALLVSWLLRRFKVQSPLLHRLAWASVLVQGLIFAGIQIELPLLEAPPASANSAEMELPANAGGNLAETDGTVAPLESPRVGAGESRAGGIGFTLGEALATIWMFGIAVTLVFYLLSYGSLILAMRRTTEAPESWRVQWRELLEEHGIRKAIPLRVHHRLGPMLCRLPDGYRVVVPAGIWRDLSESQRRAVLEHEIAHIGRGDIWKSFLARLAVVPHWFNPMAWRAVRQFDEAAEWACDRQLAKRDVRVVDYAKALLHLAEPKQPLPLGASLARGAALSPRIERLVSGSGKGDSALKGLAFALLIAGIALVAAIRIDLVAQEASPELAAPDAEFSEQVAVFAADLGGTGEQLDAFRTLLHSPAGRIVMKDRAARAEEKLKQVARDQAFERFLDDHFERAGEGDAVRLELREGQESWVERLTKLHRTYSDDIGQLQPVMEEIASNLAEASEAEKLMLRLLNEEGAAALVYVTALQKKTRPDAYAVAEELSHVFAGDGEGGFEIPEARVEAAAGFIKRGLNSIKLSEMVHEEFVIMADDFAEPDEMHKRLKAAARDSAFAAVIAFTIAKKSEGKDFDPTEVFDKAMGDIEKAFIDRGDGLHFSEEGNRGDLEELLDIYDAFQERAELLQEPVEEFAAMISEKDELHQQWQTFVNSEVGLLTLVSAANFGAARPDDLFKTMVDSVLEPAGDGKRRVMEDRRDEVIANMQKTLRTLREARRKGRQFERIAERIDDEALREILMSTPGKLIAGQSIQRQLSTERFDGLGFWIRQHFDRDDDGKLAAKSSAGEAIASALEDGKKIAGNLKADF